MSIIDQASNLIFLILAYYERRIVPKLGSAIAAPRFFANFVFASSALQVAKVHLAYSSWIVTSNIILSRTHPIVCSYAVRHSFKVSTVASACLGNRYLGISVSTATAATAEDFPSTVDHGISGIPQPRLGLDNLGFARGGRDSSSSLLNIKPKHSSPLHLHLHQHQHSIFNSLSFLHSHPIFNSPPSTSK